MLYICKREDEATSTASARSALVNSWRITSEHRVNIVHSSNKPQTFTLRSTTFLNPKNSKTMGTVKGRHSRLSSTTLRGYMMAKQMALLVDDSTVACICVVHHETIKKSPSPPVKAVEGGECNPPRDPYFLFSGAASISANNLRARAISSSGAFCKERKSAKSLTTWRASCCKPNSRNFLATGIPMLLFLCKA